MSVVIPGTTIEVDHYRDRTWMHEVISPHGEDYVARIWRERLGFADADEEHVVYRERMSIPSSKVNGVYYPGKPERLSVKVSDLVGAIGQVRDLKAAVQAVDPSFDPGVSMMLSDHPLIVISAIELVCVDCNARRVLDLKLANADITKEDYDAAVALLLPSVEF